MRLYVPILCLAVVASAGCDNVGKIWNPGGGGGGGGGTGSGIQEMVVGGNADTNSRPRLEVVFPKGGGWPETVPIVVVFNETMNFDSISPPQSGEDPGLFVRAAGEGNPPLPAAYDFLMGGTVVVIRPTAPLVAPGTGVVGQGSPDFEVVIQPTVTDCDGVTFGGSADNVIAEFITDEALGGSALNMVENGRILVTLPLNNPTDQPREIPVYAIFTKPADQDSVEGNFEVRLGTTPVQGALTFPLPSTAAITTQSRDGRVLRFTPTDPALEGNVQYQIRVNDQITFNNGLGKLEFLRNPISRFTTVGFLAPTDVLVGNPSPGFPDWVNRGNVDNLKIDVDLAATAASGDTIVARIYGLGRSGEQNDIQFVERRTTLSSSGAQTAVIDFGTSLGTPSSPRFADGALTFAAQIRRGGGKRTGFFVTGPGPRQDTVPPELDQVGPPGTSGGDLFVDQEFVSFYGQASERIGEGQVTISGMNASLFASDAEGGFVLQPINLGLNEGPLPYQLTLTDAAGNMSPDVFSGNIVGRGVVKDSVAGGGLEVEVYDEATFRPISGATVVVQPNPASSSGRMVATTGSNGRVTFSGLAAQPHTITAAISSFDLTTLMDTSAGFVSLPLRPVNGAVADFSGAIAFATPGTTLGAGETVLVGNNTIDDILVQNVQTPSVAPTAIPNTVIRPNRMQVLTGFGGLFEPLAIPSYAYVGCQMCGVGGLTPSAPGAPVPPGESSIQNFTLLAIGSNFRNLAVSSVDFGLAPGLDTGNLTGTPRVRVVGNLLGFGGQTLFGAGFAQGAPAPQYNVNGTFSPTLGGTLAPYAPLLYVSTEATDQSGNVSRHRGLINTTTGAVPPLFNPPGIPTIQDPPPGGPFTGAPLVTYDDYLSTTPPGFGFLQITATNEAGIRDWVVLRQDTDGVNLGATVQLPDLTGTGAPRLAPGRWSVRTETTLMVSTTFANDFYVLEEIRRQQVLYARAASVEFIVN